MKKEQVTIVSWLPMHVYSQLLQPEVIYYENISKEKSSTMVLSLKLNQVRTEQVY